MTPIFTRLLTTEEYGAYDVFNSWLNILTVLVTLNLYAGVYTQGLVVFEEDRKVFSSTLQGLTLVLTLIWTIVYTLFSGFWNNLLSLTTVQIYAMLLMMWSTAVFGFWAASQRVQFNYKLLVLVTIIISILKPLASILLVINSNDKVTARILGITFVEVLGYSAFFFIQLFRGKRFFSKKYWIYALSFNLPLVPHYLSQTVLNGADKIMIESMVGKSEAGIYGLAYSISNLMMLFNIALLNTLNPWIYQKIKRREEKDIAPVGYGCLIGIAIVNMLLIIFAPDLVRLFAPIEYYDAIWTIPPVAMSVYFIFSYSLFAGFEFYYKKTKMIMVASVVAALMNIVLNYIFINLFGYIAAGYTTLFCYIIYSVGHYLFMKRVCNKYLNGSIVYRPKTLLLISMTFITLGFIIQFTYSSNIVRYIAGGVMLAGILLFRKRIVAAAKNLLSLRKQKQS